MKNILIFTLLIPLFVISQCFVNESEFADNSFTIIPSTGNTWVDQTFYQQNQYLATSLGLYVTIGFYDDRHTGPNAFAIPSQNYNEDGQTYFGINMMNNYLATAGSNATFYVLWILSHEYSHILQYKNGGTIWQKTKWNELQADFIAGSIAAKHILENSSQSYDVNWKNYYVQQYGDVARMFFKSLGDTNFGSPSHHGTPRERSSAFIEGLNYGFQYGVRSYNDGYYSQFYLLVDNIWQASINYINLL